jgi:uncharacterized protein
MTLEKRAVEGLELEFRAEGGKAPVLRGYAAMFDKPSLDLGGFVEIIRRGAFSRSLKEGADILALAHHDSSKVLARRSAGTLSIEEDGAGLLVSIDVPNTTIGKDTAEDVRVGNLKGMSFGFVTRKDSWTAGEAGKPDLRELLDVDLHEVSAVAWPAYPDTSLALRAKPQATRSISIPTAEQMRRVNELRFRLIALKA